MRQQSLYIGALLVPEPDPLEGKGVSQGMGGWPPPSVGGPEVELPQQLLKPASQRPRRQGLPVSGEEEGVRGALGRVLRPTAGIVAEVLRRGRMERHQTGLMEFGFLNNEVGWAQLRLHIAQGEPQRFTA